MINRCKNIVIERQNVKFRELFFNSLSEQGFHLRSNKNKFGPYCYEKEIENGKSKLQFRLTYHNRLRSFSIDVDFSIIDLDRVKGEAFKALKRSYSDNNPVNLVLPTSTLVGSVGLILDKENIQLDGLDAGLFECLDMSELDLTIYIHNITSKILEYFSQIDNRHSILGVLFTPLGIFYCPTDYHFLANTACAKACNMLHIDFETIYGIRSSLQSFNIWNLSAHQFYTELHACALEVLSRRENK